MSKSSLPAMIVNVRRLEPFVLYVICLLVALFLGFLDYISGYELSFSIFYLLPVSIAAWYIGLEAGILLSIVSAAIWQISNYFAGEVFTNPAIPYWNTITRLGFFIIVTILLNRLRKTLAHEKSQASSDFLTGVLNSRAFDQIVTSEIQRSTRYGHPISLAYIDIDNFKVVNDEFGHSTGDALLRTVSGTIHVNLRASDYVARLGGDEFAILMTETGAEAGLSVVTRMQARLEEQMQEKHWPVTTSVGLVTCLKPPLSADRLIQLADEQMYFCKRGGKDCIHSTIFTG
jgi:diguanylate cyclase (GGDEF)-like protein